MKIPLFVIYSINFDNPLGRIVESQNQFDKSRLTATTGPNKRQIITSIDFQINIIKRFIIFWTILERKIFKLNLIRSGLQSLPLIVYIRYFWLIIQKFKYLFHRAWNSNDIAGCATNFLCISC